MASFSFTVDTAEMAGAVQGVSHHVNGTTAAVVGMQTAVIKAEADAASTICANVNRGFHSLILSQISQRAAKAKSAMDAKLLELSHQAGLLRHIKAQMEQDFHRIAGRYAKLFNVLNETLKARVFELDAASVRLSDNEMGRVQRRHLVAGSQVPICQLEALPAMQALGVARIKHHSLSAMDRMQSIIGKSYKLKKHTREVTAAATITERKEVALPVVLIENDDLRLAKQCLRVIYPAGWETLDRTAVETVHTRIYQPQNDLSRCETQAETLAAVRDRCYQRMETSALSVREKEVFRGLLEQSNWTSFASATP